MSKKKKFIPEVNQEVEAIDERYWAFAVPVEEAVEE